jgi:hypothetical protein
MNIPSNFIRESSRLFSRIRHPRTTLPVLTDVLATLDANGITLAVEVVPGNGANGLLKLWLV